MGKQGAAQCWDDHLSMDLPALSSALCYWRLASLHMVSLLWPNACIAPFTNIRNPALKFLQLVKFRLTFLELQAASKLFWHQYAPGTCIFVQMAEFSLCTGSLHMVYVVWTELVVIYLIYISISWYRNLNLSSKACVMMFFVKPKLLLQSYGIMNNAFWWFKGTNLSMLRGYIVFDIS
jgi:hypothetical protein